MTDDDRGEGVHRHAMLSFFKFYRSDETVAGQTIYTLELHCAGITLSIHMLPAYATMLRVDIEDTLAGRRPREH